MIKYPQKTKKEVLDHAYRPSILAYKEMRNLRILFGQQTAFCKLGKVWIGRRPVQQTAIYQSVENASWSRLRPLEKVGRIKGYMIWKIVIPYSFRMEVFMGFAFENNTLLNLPQLHNSAGETAKTLLPGTSHFIIGDHASGKTTLAAAVAASGWFVHKNTW